jgi:hypothetical protein
MRKMITKCITRTALSILLAAGWATSASAGVLTYDGVTFTATRTGSTLSIEIDAAHPSGGWANAKTIGAIQIQDVGKFDSVSLIQAPGAASGWVFMPQQLGTGGCSGGLQPDKFACYSGTHVALADDMVFKFAFTGTKLDLSDPALKVEFFDADGKKNGSLLSQNIPTGTSTGTGGEVPEPATTALVLGGIGLMGLARRRKTAAGSSAA